MKCALRLASPPPKPVLVYDGECRFCGLWIQRWRSATVDRVEYLAYQDERLAAQFPEIPRSNVEAAVHLLETDGSVYSGAEAALRALAYSPHRQWLIELYERSPLLASLAERSYSFVARHRRFFSLLTRLAWGKHLEIPQHRLVRWVFLRALGLIYLIAFISLWVQIIGLIGSDGILPAKLTMDSVRQQAEAGKLGWDRFHVVPTFCWFKTTDGFLQFQCAAGTVLSLSLIAGFAPAPCLFLLWLIYLSLATVCFTFLGFQWDNLLLETGLLAIFFAPLQLLPRIGGAPPSRIVLWLLRWLLFRLMFQSGCVKLLSDDPSWGKLTALTVHYETQPLPTWIGWYAHQLPLWSQKTCTGIMFFIELVMPFLVFCPRRLRQWACVSFIVFQLLIMLTGNYCFFNLLTIALCVVLLDDAGLLALVPSTWRSKLSTIDCPTINLLRWPRAITASLACLCVTISSMELGGMFRARIPWPRPTIALYQWVAPLRSFNGYGLFAVMTTVRNEIVVEGSNDGVTWLEYEFKYKPGALNRRPGFVEPHQPRLDWQMWFAALGKYQNNRWFVNFCLRLLEGSPQVLGLLEHNPFPNAPPRYVRAVVYQYHFTDAATRRKTGAWWRREPERLYLPAISRNQAQ